MLLISDMKKYVRRFMPLISILREYRTLAVKYLLLDIGLKSLNIAASFFLMIFVDSTPLGQVSFLYKFTLLFVLTQTLSVAGVLAKTLTLKLVENGVIAVLRQQLLRKIMGAELSSTSQFKGSYLGSRLLRDTDSINSLLIESLANCISSCFFLILLVPVLLHFGTGIVALVVVNAVLPALFVGKLRRRISEASSRYQEANAVYSAGIIDAIDGIREIKLNNSHDCEMRVLEPRLSRFYDSAVSQSLWGYGSGQLSVWIQQMMSGLLLLLLGISVQHGTVTLGQAVFVYNIAENLFYVVSGFYGLYFGMQAALVAWGRVEEIFAFKEEAGLLQVRTVGEFRFENVCVAKAGSDVVSNLNLVVERGAKLAIVGSSGAGKTTILNLFARLEHPSAGRITVDGVNIMDISPNALRERMAFFSQQAHLFDRSIRENIILGRAEANEADYVEIKRLCCLDGLDDTRVAAGTSSTLSGGERQRVALARCLLKGGDILLLDEFGSAIHRDMEMSIYDSILGKYAGRTIVCVTHRMQVAEKFSQVLHLEKGCICQC